MFAFRSPPFSSLTFSHAAIEILGFDKQSHKGVFLKIIITEVM